MRPDGSRFGRRWPLNKKSPGPQVQGFAVRRIDIGSEVDVEAGAEDIGVERYAAARSETAIEAAVEVAEIDVEILGFHADIADDGELEAGADGPPCGGRAAGREAWQGGADVADREAGGDVGQDPVERVAEPAAHGAE